jgi:hypothetical protein
MRGDVSSRYHTKFSDRDPIGIRRKPASKGPEAQYIYIFFFFECRLNSNKSRMRNISFFWEEKKLGSDKELPVAPFSKLQIFSDVMIAKQL